MLKLITPRLMGLNQMDLKMQAYLQHYQKDWFLSLVVPPHQRSFTDLPWIISNGFTGFVSNVFVSPGGQWMELLQFVKRFECDFLSGHQFYNSWPQLIIPLKRIGYLAGVHAVAQ